MRGVSGRLFHLCALLTLLVVLAVPVAFADDGATGPPPPPEARIGNPWGIAAQDEPSLIEQFAAWLVALQARIGNPGG
jgi:hypothetical protein